MFVYTIYSLIIEQSGVVLFFYYFLGAKFFALYTFIYVVFVYVGKNYLFRIGVWKAFMFLKTCEYHTYPTITLYFAAKCIIKTLIFFGCETIKKDIGAVMRGVHVRVCT